MYLLICFLTGVFIGIYGDRRGWSFSRQIFYTVLAGILLGTINNLAKADADKAFTVLEQATVHISIGTGSIVKGPSGKNYLLTNWHVCNHGSWKSKMHANYESGYLVEGPIVKLNSSYDLCASSVGKALKAIDVAKQLTLKEQIYTRGYPYGVLSYALGQFVGRVSWDYLYPIEEVGECPKNSRPYKDGSNRLVGCIVLYNDNVTNVYSRPGSSGSPVVDDNGELVGVMSSWDAGSDAGGMVRLEDIQDFMKGL